VVSKRRRAVVEAAIRAEIAHAVVVRVGVEPVLVRLVGALPAGEDLVGPGFDPRAAVQKPERLSLVGLAVPVEVHRVLAGLEGLVAVHVDPGVEAAVGAEERRMEQIHSAVDAADGDTLAGERDALDLLGPGRRRPDIRNGVRQGLGVPEQRGELDPAHQRAAGQRLDALAGHPRRKERSQVQRRLTVSQELHSMPGERRQLGLVRHGAEPDQHRRHHLTRSAIKLPVHLRAGEVHPDPGADAMGLGRCERQRRRSGDQKDGDRAHARQSNAVGRDATEPARWWDSVTS
jgi:hypothetical protein